MEDKRVLITGASGLLGRELVDKFKQKGYSILAHYYSRSGKNSVNCKWIQGDLSSVNSIREFIERNRTDIEACSYLINNYGPIIYKPISMIKGEEILSAFIQNVLPAFEIQNVLLKNSRLKVSVNILFQDAVRIKPYKNIVSYAIAKHSLLILSKSLAKHYPETKFRNIFPGSLKGSEVKKNGEEIEPGNLAHTIVEMLAAG